MKRVDLNGLWECTLPDKRRLQVEVPGCWDTYVDEKDIGEAVRYKKEVDLTKEEGRSYYLNFGGVSYYCDVYVNNSFAGSHEGIWDAFRLDITPFVKTGTNVIELDITKPGYSQGDRFPVRQVLSGFIPDVLHTFGGIWDDVNIEIYDKVHINTCYAAGSMDGSFSVHAALNVFKNETIRVDAEIISPSGETVCRLTDKLENTEPGEKKLTLEGKVSNPLLWSIDTPNLYTCRITASCEDDAHTIERNFGFREVRAEGTQILLNGKPIYLRGILHWGYYDDAVIPKPSAETIQDEIDKAKEYGFNMIKHCLYIPRREYFELADKNGVLLWIELPLWIPEVTNALYDRIKREYPRILEQIAGHPSVILLSLGCELDDKVQGNILEEMYALAKSRSSALVRDNSGSGECYDGLPVDYADFSDYHFYGEINNMEHLMETFTPSWRSTRPWLYGEFCDSDTMRDLKEIREAKGTDILKWEKWDASKNPICMLKPDFRAHLHDQRMEKYGIRQDFDIIKPLSANHSMVHRKITMEQTRTFGEICGYNITSIRDVPIATSGMFDDLMRPKFPKEEFRTFNSDIVLSPAWDLTRIWINADRVLYKERFSFFSGSYYGLHIILSNYHGKPLSRPVMKWKLMHGDKVIAERTINSDRTFNPGDVRELGYVSTTLPKVETPVTLILKVEMDAGEVHSENQWPVFVYPAEEKTDLKIGLYDPANVFTRLDDLYETFEIQDGEDVKGADVVVTSRLTPQIRKFAAGGGKVFYVQRGSGYLPYAKVAFWREGMIRYYDHPVLKGISYDSWMDDLRFYDLTTDTALDTFEFERVGLSPEQVTPLIRRYDCREWTSADYMAEITLGSGKIIATTLRFEGGYGKQPLFIKNNTFGRWLLNSSLNYLVRGEGKEE
ncbi:MAG TPA: hypothetical protein GX505_12070 [Clostridiales bacterium]|nr:hypothetical protein [Clostridiales bacterium]